MIGSGHPKSASITFDRKTFHLVADFCKRLEVSSNRWNSSHPGPGRWCSMQRKNVTVYFNELLALVKRSGFKVLSNTLITHCTKCSRSPSPDVCAVMSEYAHARQQLSGSWFVGGVRRLTERRWPRINHPGRGQTGQLDLTWLQVIFNPLAEGATSSAKLCWSINILMNVHHTHDTSDSWSPSALVLKGWNVSQWTAASHWKMEDAKKKKSCNVFTWMKPRRG